MSVPCVRGCVTILTKDVSSAATRRESRNAVEAGSLNRGTLPGTTSPAVRGDDSDYGRNSGCENHQTRDRRPDYLRGEALSKG